MVLDGAINVAAFLAYTKQFLVPTLQPGDGVMLHNLSSHLGSVENHRELMMADPR